MSANQPDPPKPKLRWYQYRLRTLLIFVTIVAILCSLFATITQSARRQKEAVKTIRKCGGQAYYDFQMTGKDGYDFWVEGIMDGPPKPNLLSKYLGFDFLHSVECVFCNDPKVNDAILEPLRALPNLKRLDLRNTRVSDSGLRNLGEMPCLKCLILEGSPIGDEGLEGLHVMRNLLYLNLSGTKITDKGLEHLAGMVQLNSLILDNTKITDAGVEKLKKALPNTSIR